MSNLQGLASEWDSIPRLRDRMRQVGRIIVDRPAEGESEKACDILMKSVENVKHNAAGLKPVVARLAGHTDKVVEVDALTSQIREFYEKLGMVPTAKVVSDQAWSFRYLLSTLKGHLYREKPPKDS